MNGDSVDGLPQGLASFVRNPTATRAGVPKEIARISPGFWQVDARPGDTLRLAYTLALQHDAVESDGTPKYAWSLTAAEVAFARPRLWFASGRALLAVPEGVDRAEVTVFAPTAWRTVASWERLPGSVPAFRVSSIEALQDGMIATGLMETSTREVAGVALTVATSGERLRRVRERVDRVAGASLGRFAKMMGGMPRLALGRPYRHVVLLVVEEPNPHLAGGGLAWKDIVLLMPPGDQAVERLDAAIAHELFHLWNARAFRYRTPRESWFAEGVTEFYALRALRELGLLSAAAHRSRMEEAFERYRHDPWIGGGSIAMAGEQKFAHRVLVYDGGLLVAACLDADMRRATKGERSLDDLLRLMIGRFDASARRYDNAAIYAAVQELSDETTARMLARMIEGSAPLALWRCATEG